MSFLNKLIDKLILKIDTNETGNVTVDNLQKKMNKLNAKRIETNSIKNLDEDSSEQLEDT